MSKRSDDPGQGDLEDRLSAIEDRLAAVEDALGSSSRPGRRGRSLRRGGGALEQRLTEVETELQESRRLNMRLAELTDIVQELLVPMAQQDQELLEERLKRYSASL
ncbi:DUF6752 domain-containing protein [Nocardioides antri]|uniref:DUF6752 domain-containing protein n=1 Tax=Nocardioides antri TaxID=2607659 RepID=A0A5B1M304_9ACTN|nr:DUF6752 domain-containing protein [Nocardioides antri]KAA1427121.1 hypothetical protein F0U47_06280 [Nocardioides antri]